MPTGAYNRTISLFPKGIPLMPIAVYRIVEKTQESMEELIQAASDCLECKTLLLHG